MSAAYVGSPSAAGEFVLHDVTVVDPADGSRTAGCRARRSCSAG